MEELRALAERANSWGRTQSGDAHTQIHTHTHAQSTACRHRELAGTRQCPRRVKAPGSSSRTATHRGCRQGPSMLGGEKAGRGIEERHWGSTRIPRSTTVTLSVTILSQIHDCFLQDARHWRWVCTFHQHKLLQLWDPAWLFIAHDTKQCSGSSGGCSASMTTNTSAMSCV